MGGQGVPHGPAAVRQVRVPRTPSFVYKVQLYRVRYKLATHPIPLSPLQPIRSLFRETIMARSLVWETITARSNQTRLLRSNFSLLQQVDAGEPPVHNHCPLFRHTRDTTVGRQPLQKTPSDFRTSPIDRFGGQSTWNSCRIV